MKFPIDDPAMADFVDRLEDINALADNTAGFVWRLQDDSGDATAIEYFGNDKLVNMSVWENLESLHAYVYRSAHNEVMALRKQWFDRMLEAYSVLWWIPAGTVPTIVQADERLQCLRHNGPGAEAFTFKQIFTAV